MNKFRVGDKVRIKKDLEVYYGYDGGCWFTSAMKRYRGKTAIVTSCSSACCGNRYVLNIDGGCWYWSDSMLEKVENKKHFKSLPRDFTGTIDVEKGFIVNKEILDEVEKEYLSAVIKPFKKKVAFIRLEEYGYSSEKFYICVRLNDYGSITLPFFKKGTMYKGMRVSNKYTLEELGLD